MFHQLFNTVSNEEKSAAIEHLFERSAPSQDFFLMVLLSVLMATLGLLVDSPAVIVGSMLIAPILYPTLGLAMGIIMSDIDLSSKSLLVLAKASGLGLIVATGTALLFSSQAGEFGNEIILRTEPSLLYAAIGVIAGLAAAFALIKPKLSETLPGVAISVALVPPLAVIGIGLARFDLAIVLNSLLLFVINVVGVVFAATIVFSLMNLHVKRSEAKKVIKQEEKKIEEVESANGKKTADKNK